MPKEAAPNRRFRRSSPAALGAISSAAFSRRRSLPCFEVVAEGTSPAFSRSSPALRLPSYLTTVPPLAVYSDTPAQQLQSGFLTASSRQRLASHKLCSHQRGHCALEASASPDIAPVDRLDLGCFRTGARDRDTGISGLQETESALHYVGFLCVSKCPSDRFSFPTEVPDGPVSRPPAPGNPTVRSSIG